MPDVYSSSFDETDANNNSASPNGFPEGMAPSGVNDGARAVMGAIKRLANQLIPKTTAGTTTAYTVSYGVAPSALVDGMTFLVKLNAASGTNPTLNVNSTGAYPFYIWNGTAFAQVTTAGTLPSGLVLRVSYNQGEGSFRIVSTAATALGAAFLGIANAFTAACTFSATVTMSAAALNEAVRVDVASASTCDIGAAASNYVRITGTTTITGLGTVASGVRRHVVFAGALALTYDATALILPGAATITTAAGDTATFLSEGSGNWRCISYQRASGRALAEYSAPQTAKCYATNSGGTWTIAKGSGIASITTLGTGSYEVTMSPAMPDVNYSAQVTPRGAYNWYFNEDRDFTRTTTKFRFYTAGDNEGPQSPIAVSISVDSLA